MSRGWEPRHVEADLRHDDPRCQHVDTGDRRQQRNQALKGGLTGLDLPIHPGDERGNVAIDVLDPGVRELNVLHVKVEKEAMMIGHPTAEGLAQLLSRSLDPTIRQRRRLDRISLTCNQSLDHRPSALADDVGDDRVELDVGAL